MYYDINVAKRFQPKAMAPEYRHLFATNKRSCLCTEDAVKVLKELMNAFPYPEYSISVIRWDEVGTGVDIESLLKL